MPTTWLDWALFMFFSVSTVAVLVAIAIGAPFAWGALNYRYTGIHKNDDLDAEDSGAHYVNKYWADAAANAEKSDIANDPWPTEVITNSPVIPEPEKSAFFTDPLTGGQIAYDDLYAKYPTTEDTEIIDKESPDYHG